MKTLNITSLDAPKLKQVEGNRDQAPKKRGQKTSKTIEGAKGIEEGEGDKAPQKRRKLLMRGSKLNKKVVVSNEKSGAKSKYLDDLSSKEGTCDEGTSSEEEEEEEGNEMEEEGQEGGEVEGEVSKIIIGNEGGEAEASKLSRCWWDDKVATFTFRHNKDTPMIP